MADSAPRCCTSCAARMPANDGHPKCLLCLGEGHILETCTHCQAFKKQTRWQRTTRLKQALWWRALTSFTPGVDNPPGEDSSKPARARRGAVSPGEGPSAAPVMNRKHHAAKEPLPVASEPAQDCAVSLASGAPWVQPPLIWDWSSWAPPSQQLHPCLWPPPHTARPPWPQWRLPHPPPPRSPALHSKHTRATHQDRSTRNCWSISQDSGQRRSPASGCPHSPTTPTLSPGRQVWNQDLSFSPAKRSNFSDMVLRMAEDLNFQTCQPPEPEADPCYDALASGDNTTVSIPVTAVLHSTAVLEGPVWPSGHLTQG
ncbi:valacyclovir hydrolase isoform X2 [Varanus komodoensis]|uniref:valacyclovir hydrolase isoform X2 n=1 Tax=Varanus komodoensis TaxID=61221 RepID=UPI001CF79058|nr:valacyclovir hydrolase isoform X2 [Varanus komodoensis]